MSILNARYTRSQIKALWRWCRERFTASAFSELRCCDDLELEQMAHDVGVSIPEFNTLVSRCPYSVDPLFDRMAALHLSRDEVARVEPAVFHDLQRVCSTCESHGRCMRDLKRDADDPAWKVYCLNAGTLMDLAALSIGSPHR